MLKRKDKILISAMQLLGEEGITGITMKNIASKQNISEPALYKQYKNKNEIIFQMVKEYEVYDKQIQETVTQSSLRGKEAVMFYIERYAELYENYYQLTTITLSMDLYFYNLETKHIKNQIRCTRSVYLKNLIEEYLVADEVGNKLDADTISTCIEGIILKEIYDWRYEGRTYSLKEKIMSKVNNLL